MGRAAGPSLTFSDFYQRKQRLNTETSLQLSENMTLLQCRIIQVSSAKKPVHCIMRGSDQNLAAALLAGSLCADISPSTETKYSK
jgi:hypothetical protein